MSENIRARIAPSPTGAPHVGTAYIALFNYCYVRKHGGQFIMRIEDTDRARSTRASEEHILRALKWLGFNWDEGPDVGGQFGPYRQSERSDIYRDHIEKLVASGHAYYCFCSSDDLERMRRNQALGGRATGYFSHGSPCVHLPLEEARKLVAAGKSHVIRLRVTRDREMVRFFDQIRQEYIAKPTATIDDQILVKSDGFPTYHLANVVDDHLMKITDVIRGEEWISSTPKHVLLYEAFGWGMPRFHHLSLLRNTDSSKISKRKNPVSLDWFQAAGYLPQALINFLGLMGYSPDISGLDEQEIKKAERFDMKKMMADFDMGRITSSSPVFDYVKLDNLNDEYLRNLSWADFIAHEKAHTDALGDYVAEYSDCIINRCKRSGDTLSRWCDFLFVISPSYKLESLVPKKTEVQTVKDILTQVRKALKKEIGNPEIHTLEGLKTFLIGVQEQILVDKKPFLLSIRAAITGSTRSLPLYESMLMLGLYGCLVRLDMAQNFLKRHK